MNAPALITPPTEIGSPFEGGFYAGRIRVGEQLFALIVAPKSAEIDAGPWHKNLKPAAGAMSFCDGIANTQAMAEAGSPLAKKLLALEVSGFVDWYLPARDELELLYRGFKPTAAKNYCYRGDNPSSIPVGYAYLPDSPEQTTLEAFRRGGAEAFEADWYWSSTQHAGDERFAWIQGFGDGGQFNVRKDDDYRARPVRRLPL